MSLYNNTDSEPHKSIFDVFSMGRGYFRLRTMLACAFTLLASIAAAILTWLSLGIYPTIVRDSNSRVYMGTSKAYTTTYSELSGTAIDTMRCLFTKTPKSDLGALRPFVAENILAQVRKSISGFSAETLQSTLVHDFFITESGKTVQAVIYMTIIQTGKKRILEQPAYFNMLLKYAGHTEANPGGWKIIGLLRIDEATYLEKRRRTFGESAAAGESALLNPGDTMAKTQ